MSGVDMVNVRKRDDKTNQKFNKQKIRNAINKSFGELDKEHGGDLDTLVEIIAQAALEYAADNDNTIHVEQIQRIVKTKLMELGHHDVAEAYIIYAHRRSELRNKRLEPDAELLSDYIQLTKYARYDADRKRRELWKETNDRTRTMHLDRFPDIADDINWSFDRMDQKRTICSMRSRQYGGAAQLAHHAKGYNCSFSVCNRPSFFKEALYLLLCGTGVGFSVQYRHVEQMPSLTWIDRTRVKHHVVDDTIEGWSDALDELIKSYIKGYYVEFSYHRIRDQGTILKTSGGRAPGHLPLKTSLERIRGVLDGAQGRQLDPIECYDITCMAADAVYSGGIREAALIALFSIDDPYMMNAKTRDWYVTHPWRQRSNNSVVLVRNEVTKSQFKRIFRATRQWGEPGFYFTNDPDSGANPCVEIGLNPRLEITEDTVAWLEQWAAKRGVKLPKLKIGTTLWGWQMCNLSEVNAAACKTVDEFYDSVKAATIIGTLQASFTDFPYLGWVTEAICDREALLGVSLTGMMDNPDIALDPQIQKTAAKLAVKVNKEYAEKIGINPAARVTCVKPSGTASLVIGGVGSGIHPHHARRYFRRIKATPGNPVYEFFKRHNPHMCSDIDEFKAMITFPIKAPDQAILRDDLGAIEFLEKVRSTQINWVLPGTARPDSSPGVNHNVSNTITVRDHEWDDVSEFLWKNRQYFSGVSMLGYVGDKNYENAPREAVVNDADEAKWQHLISNYKPVDWRQMIELEDGTELSGEIACAGGVCETGI